MTEIDTTLPVVQDEVQHAEQDPDIPVEGLLLNSKAMNTMFKLAKMYAASKIVPESYQNKTENCLVAIEMAARMNVSPTFVMQQLYIVQGKPSWSGQAAYALLQNTRKFRSLEYVFVGEPGTNNWGCYLQGENTKTGKLTKGATVTLQMAKDEGWYSKKGSKWQTMPEQMMRYRAAAFFARAECPEALMGFQTTDEVEDVQGTERPEKETVKLTLNSSN